MPLTLVGGAIGAGVGAVSDVGSRVQRGIAPIARTLSMNISAGEVIKYGIYIVLILFVIVSLLNGLRGVMIWMDQTACTLANAPNCVWHISSGGLLGSSCELACPAIEMASYNWMWVEEWLLRCFLALTVAVTVGTMLYIWLKKLFDILTNLEKYMAMIDEWIFGDRFSGAAEEVI